jgi:prepilin-type N-terminal cleavage/methylation domain-containing protein
MRSSRRTDRRGFSLVELMVTIVIIGIGLSLVLPRINSSIRMARLEETQARLQSDVKLAISTAKATGRSVLIDYTADGYRLVDSVDTNRIYASSNTPKGVNLASSGTTQVFPWGLVTEGTVQIYSSEGLHNYTILPSGKIEEGTGN